MAVLGAAVWIGLACGPAHARSADELIPEAREAHKRGDKARLSSLRATVMASNHPLASWVDYWDLASRLNSAQASEVDAFFGRWSGTYVEDRLRNDWLLELGRRRDWAGVAREHPRFRMNDDREVSCYALLTQHLDGKDVSEAGRAAWLAQREADDGCQLLATTLVEARRLQPADLWLKARLALEANRPRSVRAALALLGPAEERSSAEVLDGPAKFLARKTAPAGLSAESWAGLRALAVSRLAASDAPTAAGLLQQAALRDLPPAWMALATAGVARQSAMKLLPEANGLYQAAWGWQDKADAPLPWSDDTLAWQVRAALRAGTPQQVPWAGVRRAVEAMSAAEQRDPAWIYWKARALQGLAAEGPPGESARAAARALMQSIQSPFTFYGKLATEDLGLRVSLPASAAPITATERNAALSHPGLQRALQLISLSLRNEGVREWNFSLRGMADRELLAAAQLACDRQVWDRCINTSDRTRGEFDLAQRFPTPYREEVLRASRDIGLDPAYVYGLIRQESRFVLDARSSAGASGLMQIMPATARWTAKKVGLNWKPEMITDRDINLKLGTAYLKLVLDDFGGSVAMAAAAYNAGPGRPRRWREGGLFEPAAWAEGIPFQETRDYVKKVLSNTTLYATLLRQDPPLLKPRLGGLIGPREATAAAPDKDLP